AAAGLSPETGVPVGGHRAVAAVGADEVVLAAHPRGRIATPNEELQKCRRSRRLEPEMAEGAAGRDAPARGALEQPALEQIGLIDILDRVLLLPHGHGQRRESHGPAGELLADRA